MGQTGDKGAPGPPGYSAGSIVTFLVREEGDPGLRTNTRFVPTGQEMAVMKFLREKVDHRGLPILDPGEYEEFYHNVIYGNTKRKFNLLKQIKDILNGNGRSSLGSRKKTKETV